MNNDKDSKSAYIEIYEVSKDLDNVRQEESDQRLEIIKFQNIVQPYLLALEALDNSLNQILVRKAVLKKRKLELLNIISNSDSEDENTQFLKIKSELDYNDNSSASLLSFNCENSNEFFNSSLVNQTTNKKSNVLTCNAKLSNIHNTSLSNRCTNDDKSLKNKHAALNDKKIIPTIENNIKNVELIGQPVKELDKSNLKRKHNSDEMKILVNKIPKLNNNVSILFQFEDRKLTCILYCKRGIVLAGSKGLLQLRDSETYNAIRRYEGFDNETVAYIEIFKRNKDYIILSYAKSKFIAFNLSNGNIICEQEFATNITVLKYIDSILWIGTESGSFYSFNLFKFDEALTETKIMNTFVQSILPFKSYGKLLCLLGCQNGIMYLTDKTYSNPTPIIENKDNNVYDLMLLISGSYILSYSDKTIDILNKNTLKMKISRPYLNRIVKVKNDERNVFVLFEDGSVDIYPMKNSVPDFSHFKTILTMDTTLKDISVDDKNAFLIGESSVYLLKF